MAKKKTVGEEESKTESVKSGKVSKIIFTIKSSNHASHTCERVFDEENHGEDFEEVADEFEKNNKGEILDKRSE